ncbi:hypothetical protein VTK73DRAFT_7768 [Phialemonium thermophilum]|uniref:N-acetylglucosaminylphosphatidylinositol deacetylase n=1 Tax=Phialemonium thermophilum TaxID=223376 RepID=A0ABR3XRG6_9PEZI
MEWLLVLGVLVLVIPSLYLYSVAVVQTRFPTLRNKRICLLIAHPDDEAMFFAPTVLALTKPETGNHVKILCLSSGNADGLGETRKKELVKSGMMLGLRTEDDVFVVDSPDFPDGMNITWDPARISALLSSAFVPRPTNSPSAAPTATIDVLLTFDAGGVSGHPNHASLYHGARAFVRALTHGRSGWRAPVDLYTLATVPLVRKYTGGLDVLPTLALWAFRSDFKAPRDRPTSLVFLNGFGAGGLVTAWRAMTTAHRSQMLWFRYGWLGFSRYMLMNDLQLENAKSR